MNKSNKQILRDLVGELNMSLAPKEVDENLEHLSEEEAGLLVKKYSLIKQYRDKVEKYVAKASPEEYKKLKAEHDKKLSELESKYLDDMEKAQQEADSEIEEIEQKASDELDKVSEELEKGVNAILEAKENIDEKLESLASSK